MLCGCCMRQTTTAATMQLRIQCCRLMTLSVRPSVRLSACAVPLLKTINHPRSRRRRSHTRNSDSREHWTLSDAGGAPDQHSKRLLHHYRKEICVLPPTHADKVALPAASRCCCSSQWTSAPPGTQQQTRRMLLRWATGTDRLTDTVPFHRLTCRRACSAYHACRAKNYTLNV